MVLLCPQRAPATTDPCRTPKLGAGPDSLNVIGNCCSYYIEPFENFDQVIAWERPDINVPDNHEFIPIHAAAGKNAVDALKWLKAQGADINAQDNDGETPMHYAAWKNSVDALKWLKAQGADINAQDNSGDTPMHYAAVGGAVDALEWFRANGGRE